MVNDTLMYAEALLWNRAERLGKQTELSELLAVNES